MSRATRNYLIRRYALGPVFRIATALLAVLGLAISPLRNAVRKPVFIVGCSRSGTTLFAEIFGARRDICNLMDASQIWDLSYYDKSGDDHRDENDANFWESARIRSSLGIHVIVAGGKRLINKNNQNSLRLRFLKALFPDAYIVHVIRDARPVVLSNMSRVEKDSYRRNFPFGRFPKPIAWRSYMDKPLVEQFAHQWRDVTAIARDDGRRLFGTDQYVEVKFEDFCANPAACIDRIDQFCGLPALRRNPEKLSTIGTGESDSWVNRLPEEDIDRIVEITGGQMNNLGYAVETSG